MHPIVEANRYMTLSTADADGVPWASPVWYAPDGPDALLWVSDPSARHSRIRLPEFTRADITAPARLRLYRATLTEQWVLGPGDRRLPLA
jgi:pyridoxamine 5'-phosphate oxidase-like protein